MAFRVTLKNNKANSVSVMMLPHSWFEISHILKTFNGRILQEWWQNHQKLCERRSYVIVYYFAQC